MILETFKIIIDFHNVKSSPHVKQVDHQKFAIQSSEEQIMATNLKKSFPPLQTTFLQEHISGV